MRWWVGLVENWDGWSERKDVDWEIRGYGTKVGKLLTRVFFNNCKVR